VLVLGWEGVVDVSGGREVEELVVVGWVVFEKFVDEFGIVDGSGSQQLFPRKGAEPKI